MYIVPLHKAVEQLPGKLRLEQARTLAKPRVEILRALIEAIQAEVGDLLF